LKERSEGMSEKYDRRNFLRLSSALAVAATTVDPMVEASSLNFGKSELKKAACVGVMPRDKSVLERFQLAKALGFEGIEPKTLSTNEEVAEYKEASQKTGVKIHSIMNSDHWKFPLTDNDPKVVKASIEGIETSMRNAHDLGADAVLLVPGIVTSQVGYAKVYQRSQRQVRELIPLAEELDVVITIENVGNRFLLSPIEFARYVDEFESPYVRAYFDVGNVTSIGFPPDWIRTLGRRLLKVHIKKFEPGRDIPKFDPNDRRSEGIDWPDVRRALYEVGFKGWVSAEVRSGPENYLRELSSRIDRILEGKDPA
jgi:hexulose-6-phosphate isomerase